MINAICNFTIFFLRTFHLTYVVIPYQSSPLGSLSSEELQVTQPRFFFLPACSNSLFSELSDPTNTAPPLPLYSILSLFAVSDGCYNGPIGGVHA